MTALLRVAGQIVQSMPSFVVTPLFWAVILLVGFQYSRIALNERRGFGVALNPASRQVLGATAQGLIGGLLASLLMVLIGITVSGNDLVYIWAVAIALMLIQPRLICFSYAAGLVSVVSLLFGWPRVDIPGLLGLVAVLHVTESALILIGGHQTATPAKIENRAGHTVGGFLLQRYWPVPFFALVISGGSGGGGVPMPDWWPLIAPAGVATANLTLSMVPVVAALGYGDLAIAAAPRLKSRTSALYLAGYSASLLALAVLAARYPSLTFLAAVFSPAGHELVVILGGRHELVDEPHHGLRENGLAVLAVVPGSPAHAAGIVTGDTIVAINDAPVYTAADIAGAMLPGWPGVIFRVERGGEEVMLRASWSGGNLGIIPVPEPGDQPTLVARRPTALSRLVEKVLYRLRRQ